MKIVYSVGDRIGTNTQLIRFLENIDKRHEVKVAAYISSSQGVPHIDWTLDALHYNILGTKNKKLLISLFKRESVPSLNLKNASILVKEIGDFNPDLIISDFEPIVSYIAKLYNKKLWYCSSLHLLDGCEWDYDSFDYLYKIDETKKLLKNMPVADKYYIYSSFGDIFFRPTLKSKYQWITPYYKHSENLLKIDNTQRYNKIKYIFNYLNEYKEDFFITDGSTSNIADAFYSGKKIIVLPTLNNCENLINAILVKKYNIGTDLGQIELMDRFSVEQFEKSFEKKYNENYLSIQNYPQLHERVEEYVCSV